MADQPPVTPDSWSEDLTLVLTNYVISFTESAIAKSFYDLFASYDVFTRNYLKYFLFIEILLN